MVLFRGFLIRNSTRISTPFKRIAIGLLLSVLKLIIHLKRLLTAFFVKAVFTPLVFLAKLFFDWIFVPVYRLYTRLGRSVSNTGTVAPNITDFFTGRYGIHALVFLVACSLVWYNVAPKPATVSSDELVGKTVLGRIVTQDSTDFDQFVEEYPNLDIARWQSFIPRPLSILTSPLTIYTKERPSAVIVQQPSAARTDTVVYTVQNGDTISGLARRFNVSVNTILWENNLSATAVIRAGDKLTILQTSGVSHIVARGQTLGQIAKLYNVTAEEIMGANGISNANQLRIGAKLVIPGGNRVIAAAPASSVSSRAAQTLKNIIIPKPSAIIPAGGKMVWPTVGHTITQYFSWRHTGVDIANHIGTPIYAADSGTVETVGYNRGGYGNQIIINHGGGKKTRYAHLSAFKVKVGQKVSKGEYIGAMGSTGRSTGPHLHFEVIINGAVYNPLNYTR